MITIRIPKSDLACLSMLNRTSSVGWSDRYAGRDYLSEETLGRSSDQYQLLSESVRIRKEARAARKMAKSTLDEAVDVLKPIVQDACANLRRATRRTLPDSVLNYYGLPKTGETPFPTARAEWVQWGIQLLQGDNSARNAGYPGMNERHELEEATMTALHALHELDRADGADTVALDELKRVRRDVDALAREIRLQLRFAVHHMPDAQQRAVFYAYGLRRRYSSNQTAEKSATDNGTPTPEQTGSEGEASTGLSDGNQAAESAEQSDTGVPIIYSVPLTLQSDGNGVFSTSSNGNSNGNGTH